MSKPEDERPFVSVVITVMNMEKTIEGCLRSIIETDYPNDRYEIVIVDGLSKDKTQDAIREIAKLHKQPVIKLFEKKGGIGAGRNEALKHVSGDLVAITDADIEVSRVWLSELVGSFEEGIAGVGGPNNNADEDSLTRCISSLDIQGPSNDVVYLISENPYSKEFTSKTDIYTTVTRNACYRKRVLEEIGGFDETLIGSEDPELNMRILKKGYSLRYNPKAVVYHHHRSYLSRFFRQQRLFAVGQAFVNKKHPEMFKPIHLLPTLAFVALAVLLIASFFMPTLVYLVLIIVLGYIGLFFVYGLKSAKKWDDIRVAFLMPVVVFVWHFAWVIYYPEGVLTRKDYGK